MNPITVSRATVICGDGADKCYLHIADKIAPIWPFKEELVLGFEAAKNSGAEYIKETFDIEPEVIQTR